MKAPSDVSSCFAFAIGRSQGHLEGMRFGCLLLVLTACSSPDDSLSGPSDAGVQRVDVNNGPGLELDAFPEIDAANVDLVLLPEISHSGFDGVHTFQAPIAIYKHDPKDLTVSISDPSLVDVIPAAFSMPAEDNGRYFLLKSKKAGTAMITVRSRGKSVAATLKIAAYDSASYGAGETRYRMAGTNGDKACATCHEAADGADHSPTALSASDDLALGVTIRSGIKNGVPTRVPHRWTVTDVELKGLVAFLRGLPARGYTPQ